MMQHVSPPASLRSQFIGLRLAMHRHRLLAAVAVVACIAVAAWIAQDQLQRYRATARAKVVAASPAVNVFGADGPGSVDPLSIQSQVELLRSHAVLAAVVRRLDLQRRWSSAGDAPLSLDDACNRLNSRLTIWRRPDSAVVEITCRDNDPELAAAIANAVVDIRAAQALDSIQSVQQEAMGRLRVELAAQEDALGRAQQQVEQLRATLDEPVVGNGAPGDTSLNQLELQLTQSRIDVLAQQVRLTALKSLMALGAGSAASLIVDDAQLRTLRQAMAATEVNYGMLRRTYGASHPAVIAASAQRQEIAAQMDQRLAEVLSGAQGNLQLAQQRTQALVAALDQHKAASLASAAQRLLPWRNAQRLADLQARICDAIRSKIQQATVSMQVASAPLTLEDRATPPTTPDAPTMPISLAIGAAMGLLIAAALTFTVDHLDASFKNVAEVENTLHLSVLGVLPQLGRRAAGRALRSPGEPVHMLCNAVRFACAGTAPRSLCLTSAARGEGKTYTALALAAAYARQGLRVLLVDGDTANPSLHRSLGVSGEAGLSDYLLDGRSIDMLIQPTSVAGVSVLPAGPVPMAGTFCSQTPRLRSLVRELASRFDLVIYDTPPLLSSSAAASIIYEVGNCLLVVGHRRQSQAWVARARRLAAEAGARLVGAVVNAVEPAELGAIFDNHLDAFPGAQRPALSYPHAEPQAGSLAA